MSCSAIRYNIVDTLLSPPLCRDVLSICSSSFGRNFTLMAIPYLLKSCTAKYDISKDSVLIAHIVFILYKADLSCTTHSTEEAGKLLVNLADEILQRIKPPSDSDKSPNECSSSFRVCVCVCVLYNCIL